MHPKKFLALFLFTWAVASPVLAQEARELFERGYYLEHGLKKLGEAIEVYRRAATLAEASDRALAGRAWIRIATCERERGHDLEAQQTLLLVVERYGDLKDVRAEAEALLGDEGMVRRSLRTYDIEFLVRRVADYPAPRISMAPADQAEGAEGATVGAVLTFSGAEEGVGLDPDQVTDLITRNIAEDSWQNERNRIEVSGYTLLVVQTADVHEQVERFLDRMRRLRGRLVTFDVRIALVEGRVLSRVLASGSVLSPDAEKDLHRRFSEKDGARLLERHQLSAFNQQRVHLAPIAVHRFLGDYRTELTGVIPVLEPVIEEIHLGSIVEVRPMLVAEGGLIQVEILASLLESAGSRTARFGPPEAAVELPTADVFHMATVGILEPGRTIVAGGVKTGRYVSDDAGEKVLDDPRLVILLRPSLAPLEKDEDAPAPPGAPRTLRIYNVSLLTDFEDPPSAPNPFRAGLLSGFGMADDFADSLEPEYLLEMIQANLSPDAWQNSLNRLDFADGQLMVVAPPTVHAQIESFIGSLRRKSGTMLTVEVYRFDATPEVLEGIRSEAEEVEGGAHALPSSALDRLLAGAAPLSDWLVLSGRNGRTLQIMDTRQSRYVKSYVRTAGGTGAIVATVADPLIGLVAGGIHARLRAKLLPDGRQVSVELEQDMGDVASSRTFPEIDTPWGPVETPWSATHRFSIDLTFPIDRVLLIGAATGAPGGSGRGVMLLRVTSHDVFASK